MTWRRPPSHISREAEHLYRLDYTTGAAIGGANDEGCPASMAMNRNDRRGESVYSPAMLGIAAHCGRICESALRHGSSVVSASRFTSPCNQIWVMICVLCEGQGVRASGSLQH